jgi:tetratricopeptide (TPR) repeat protein
MAAWELLQPNARWRGRNPRVHCVQSVKKIHTPKLRAESKHVVPRRQLLALAGGLLLGISCLHAAPPVTPPAETPQGELHAAQWMAAALFARQADQEELQKLDRVFADLEAKYPRDAAMANGHAEFLWNTGEHDRAWKTWLAAEKLDPNNATVLDHLGGCSLATSEVKKAAGYYARAVSIAPDNADYQFSYANVAFLFRHDLHDAAHPDSESMLVEALQHFSEAARLEPLNAEYARAFAETFYALEKPDWHEALKAWQHLADILPAKDFALLNIARVQMKLGRKPEARASLAQIQDPKYGRLKARLSERIEAE